MEYSTLAVPKATMNFLPHEITRTSSLNRSFATDSNSVLLGRGTGASSGSGAAPTLQNGPYVVHAAALGRIYHAQLNTKPDQWTYARLKGTLVFGRDQDEAEREHDGLDIRHGELMGENKSRSESEGCVEKHWFRLVDELSGRTVWIFKFPSNLRYQADRPFFHVFEGRTRKYGFLFDDDDEANLFLQKVNTHLPTTAGNDIPKKSRNNSILGRKTKSKTLPSRKNTLSSSSSPNLKLISSPAPSSFKHVAHIGISKEGSFEASKNVDPALTAVLAELQFHGSNKSITVLDQFDFMEALWRDGNAINLKLDGKVNGDNVSYKEHLGPEFLSYFPAT